MRYRVSHIIADNATELEKMIEEELDAGDEIISATFSMDAQSVVLLIKKNADFPA